mmetsp:Transcript_24581/g.40457  ORF Transcript_24581/g.40457 Transcript_24581/m.40457 type:complete len:195 (+) Transcript_24581:197-781(+)
MYAPLYHPSFKALIPVRSALRVRTAFNMIGPLLNPAHARYAVLGVFSESIIAPIAQTATLMELFDKAWIVHSEGIDEFTPTAPATVIEAARNKTSGIFSIDPETLGIGRCTVADLQSPTGTAEDNAKALVSVFQGQPGPIADAIVLNAGIALYVNGLAETVDQGVRLAREAQQQGAAYEVLKLWVDLSQQLSRK